MFFNLLLMLLAETGFPATFVLCAMVGWVLFRGVRTLSALESRDRLMLFSIILAFVSTTLFHNLDVTLFDARINLLGWILLSAIESISAQKSRDFIAVAK